MFRVFARFNPLLTRTRVRAAVREFQLQLMNTVGQAVQKLQLKFTRKYELSSALNIATIRGIPPVLVERYCGEADGTSGTCIDETNE